MSQEAGNPAMAASSSGRSVLRLRELLSRYSGNFIAFKGIYLLSQAACGAGFLPLRKRDIYHHEGYFSATAPAVRARVS
jgi:hypothetical protein